MNTKFNEIIQQLADALSGTNSTVGANIERINQIEEKINKLSNLKIEFARRGGGDGFLTGGSVNIPNETIDFLAKSPADSFSIDISAIMPYQYSNGLTELNGEVKLGGTIIEDTEIEFTDGDTISFNGVAPAGATAFGIMESYESTNDNNDLITTNSGKLAFLSPTTLSNVISATENETAGGSSAIIQSESSFFGIEGVINAFLSEYSDYESNLIHLYNGMQYSLENLGTGVISFLSVTESDFGGGVFDPSGNTATNIEADETLARIRWRDDALSYNSNVSANADRAIIQRLQGNDIRTEVEASGTQSRMRYRVGSDEKSRVVSNATTAELFASNGTSTGIVSASHNNVLLRFQENSVSQLTFSDGLLSIGANDINISSGSSLLDRVSVSGKKFVIQSENTQISLPEYDNNADAAGAGLTAGTLYKTPTGEVRIVV